MTDKYYFVLLAGKCILRIGGFKFSRTIRENDPDSPPERFNVNLGVRHNHFETDKAQCAFIMYYFLKRRNVVCRDFVYLFDFNDDDSYTYEQLHMAHLIKIIVFNEGVTIADILTHPYFWSIHQMVAFEDRLRTYSTRHREMDAWLEVDKWEVFDGDDWTANLPAGLLSVLANVPHHSIIGLWRAMRDRRHHHEEDSDAIRVIMGTLYAGNFEFWQRHFPAFFLHLYKRLACYEVDYRLTLPQAHEFGNLEFFPSSIEFYATLR